MTYDVWIIIIASLTGICCAWVGSMLVVRKMAMIGDAISHTVLLGIVMAYLLTNQLSGIWMLVGATIIGLVTAYVVQQLHQWNVRSDAAIGVTFTTLFAIAILLITLFTERIHLDLDHVLYGEIAFAPLETWSLGEISLGPQAVWILGILIILLSIVQFIFHKEWLTVSFDQQYALAIGLPALLIHYMMMTLVSLTTVISFEYVGSILVVALLVVPPATAFLLARSYLQMLILACAFAMASSVCGYLFAWWLDTSISGAMAVAAGLIFVLTALGKFLLQRRSQKI